jgi:uncharacterized protein (TIGR00730 family)
MVKVKTKKKVKESKKNNSYEKELKENDFRVTIFGSAQVKKGSRYYKDIYDLSKLIGKKGYDVVTGGGPGIMEAACNGHKAGSKNNDSVAIGLNIKLPHEQRLNAGVDVSHEFNKFSNRLDNFMLFSNVIVVAPGGVGTLLELFYSWQLMAVNHTCRLPIILYGGMWKGLLDWFKKYPLKQGYFSKEEYDLLFYAETLNEVIEIIDHAHLAYKSNNKDLCLNIKRYKV